MTSPDALADRLAAFSARILADPEVAAAAAKSGRTDAPELAATYAAEASTGLSLIAPLLRPGMRVLEVGCGIGALARFLDDQGVDITGIEPGASGFGFMPDMGRAILAMTPAMPDKHWLPIGAEKLDPALHGRFDLIFSTNVMEHIADLEGAFRGMTSVLAAGGTMVHLCPNYVVPYEPHFGVPLLPWWPGATRHLFPRTVGKYPGLWDELNFITSQRVKSLSRRNGLNTAFDRGIMGAALRRFDRDPMFRERQGRIAGLAQGAITRFGLMGWLDRLPGEWTSPMVMRLTHSNQRGAAGTNRETAS